jgi:2-polyprenyl-3-methyl-5-hydroxy-6-metoxy-1,4-benzoquinol methylase
MDSKKTAFDLNALVNTYNIDNIYEQYKRFEFIKKISTYVELENSSILEFGSASGQMTEILADRCMKVTAVDGSSEFIKIAQQRVITKNNVTFHEAYFEDFKIDEKFDCLIFHHIMEHISDPVSLIKKITPFMKKGAIVAISVPNSHALSRQLAVKMGLLTDVYQLTENDKHHGHYRVYDWSKMEEDIKKGGLSIIGRHGLSFKLFSDKQNIDILNANIIGESQIYGLWKLADDYPNISGAIMIVAKNHE